MRTGVKVSHPDKLLFPRDGVSKRDVVGHYETVAGVMLPHLAGRPLTLRRFPDGVDEGGFFQKDASDHFPDWLTTVEVPLREGGRSVHHVVCDSADALAYLANQATIEFHVWPSTVDSLERPDRLVVDIDPPDGVEVATLRAVARDLRDLFDSVGLTPYVQATGGRGFHVVAPLDATEDYDLVRPLAADLADHLAAGQPDLLTTAQRKQRRGDRIFLDVNRNAYGQTFVSPYSLRARDGAPVTTPLGWPELGRATPNGYDAARIRRRLARTADPWADMADHAASAAHARHELDRLRS